MDTLTCSICDENESVGLSCKHIVCESCLLQLRKNKCPMCGIDLAGPLVTDNVIAHIIQKEFEDDAQKIWEQEQIALKMQANSSYDPNLHYGSTDSEPSAANISYMGGMAGMNNIRELEFLGNFERSLNVIGSFLESSYDLMEQQALMDLLTFGDKDCAVPNRAASPIKSRNSKVGEKKQHMTRSKETVTQPKKVSSSERAKRGPPKIKSPVAVPNDILDPSEKSEELILDNTILAHFNLPLPPAIIQPSSVEDKPKIKLFSPPKLNLSNSSLKLLKLP